MSLYLFCLDDIEHALPRSHVKVIASLQSHKNLTGQPVALYSERADITGNRQQLADGAWQCTGAIGSADQHYHGFKGGND